MDKKIKTAKAALIISALAVIIASINLIFSIINRLSTGSAVAIFSGTIAILCSNIANYKVQKNKSSKLPNGDKVC